MKSTWTLYNVHVGQVVLFWGRHGAFMIPVCQACMSVRLAIHPDITWADEKYITLAQWWLNVVVLSAIGQHYMFAS